MPKPRRRYRFYPGMTRLDRLSAPDIRSYDSRLRAEVRLQDDRAEGVILASGDSGAGYELFMQDGLLRFVYVYTRFERYVLESPQRIGPSTTSLGLRIKTASDGSAHVGMLVDDAQVASMQLPEMWQVYAPNSGVRCGENRHAPVSRDYEAPFVFDQGLHRVIVELDLEEAEHA